MSKRNSTLTQERLKELLHYDRETGIFTWKIRTTNRTHAGDRAGTHCKTNKHRVIHADGEFFSEHRLAWFYVYGHWPEHGIDHRDGDRANNKIENLRDVPQKINMQNRRHAQTNNKSGFLGVFRDRWGKRWIARLTLNRKAIHVGTYDTPNEAHAAYLVAKRKLHEGCTI